MVELIDILNAIQGKDEKSEPKSGVAITEYIMDVTDSLKQERERTFATPSVNIVVTENFILVDLIFPKSGAGELRTAWRCLKDFEEKQNELLAEEDDAILEVTLVPLEYSGQYFCTLINPVFWSLHSSSPGLQSDTIRMLFEKEALSFLEGEKIDERLVRKEIEDEMNEEQRKREVEEQRRLEREEYLDRMNKQFNHLNE